MKFIAALIQVCTALSLVACGGSQLSVELPGGGDTLRLDFLPGQAVEHRLPFRISGGFPPYDSSIEGCPDWVTLFPEQGILAGTPPAEEGGKTYFCTYRVTESDPGFRPQRSVTYRLGLAVASPVIPVLMLPRPSKVDLSVGTFHNEALPVATGGVQPHTYSFICAGGSLPSGMGFDPATRRFAGTPDARFRDSCTYSVTDSSQPTSTVSMAVEVEVTGGATPLELTRVFEEIPGDELTLKIGRRSQTRFEVASGGVQPHTYELLDCTLPDGLEFHSSTRILSGTPNAEYRGPNCTYRVTDSSSPPASVSLSFVLTVEPLEARDWRFRTRTVAPGGPCALPGSGPVEVATLHAAHAGDGDASYALPGATRSPESGVLLSFDPGSRILTYTNPDPPPVLGTPNTFRYLVGTATRVTAGNADDALCLDIQYVPKDSNCGDDPPLTHVQIMLQMRDDAFWDENAGEYRCPDTTAPPPPSGTGGSPSNPVHEALGPVHARRALDFAHGAVVDRVKGWSPSSPRVLSAITPAIGLASLSGLSQGFDYTGSSESLSTGAELGAGSWQAGLIASVTRTDLRYRAAAVLAEHGYHAGEHNTEIFSVHPFAAWHMPSGGHLWASMGAGMGQLSHRDDVGFPSWSRSDVRLLAHAVGAALPIADVLSGELEAEAGIESFALEIEGGDRISSTLPTMRGRDYRAGLAWSAPIAGAPSLSAAYKHLTGDGPEGGQVEAKGSVSFEGVLDPRLTVISSAQGSLGLGDHEHDSWGLGGGVRFASGEGGRGFALDLDTRLGSPDDGGSSDVGIRGEAGYGLWSGPHFGTVRPYVGLIRYSSSGSLRRTLGIDLHDTRALRANVEIRDRPGDRFRALGFTLRHRF